MLLVVAGGAAVLQALGPPKVTEPPQASVVPPGPASHPSAPAAPAEAAADRPATEPASRPAPGDPLPGAPVAADWNGLVGGPDPALLEAVADDPDHKLPRRAPDGLAPMQAYARPFDRSDPRPRIALVMSGIGLSEADSRAAIETLPPAVDLAFSAYTETPGPLADLARQRGHEILLSLPMEPQGYPLNDEGPRALLTGAAPGENARNLEWALTRMQGYAGATGASDGMQGERFAGMADPFGAVARELSARGLFYIDARPEAPALPGVAGRGADVIIDQPPARAAIEAQLAKLERLARDKGSALGLAGPPHPVVVETIAAWARALESRGAVLAPASALSHGASGRP